MARIQVELTAILFALGCGGDNQSPGDASTLWNALNSQNYTAWQRAPGYPERMPSFTAHAESVEIFVNPVLGSALGSSVPLTEWPVGSIVAKRGYRGTSLVLVAAMEKRADGWFWAEYDKSGNPDFSGKPSICIDCHKDRATYSDYTFSLEFPR